MNELESNSIRATSSMDDMKFVPFTLNPSPQQLLDENMSPSDMKEMIKNINSILQTDITAMPFIPNPYYMMDMNLLFNPNSMELTDENQRQKGSFGPKQGPGFYPGFHSGFHHGYYPYHNPNFYPYYNPNFYPYYPTPYGPNNVNPLTFLLLSSMLNKR